MFDVYTNPALTKYILKINPKHERKGEIIELVKCKPILYMYLDRLKSSYMLDYEVNESAFTYALIKALYKQKLINTATYNKIMNRYDGGGLVYAKKKFERSA